MPAPSRWMIRLSLCYLMLGFSFGALMLVNKALDLSPAIWLLLPLHIETLFWGFVIQFTLGMAYWILPRYLKGADRGNPWLPWVMVGLINSGILLFLAGNMTTDNSWFRITGRGFELLSVGIFIFLHWNRITTYRNK